MTTFTWAIANLERAQDDYITIVHWRCDGEEGEHSIGAYGTVSFTQEEGEEIIPFADLTEAVVIDWVKEKLDVEAMETGFDAQLAELAAPKSATGMPWGN